MVRQEKGMELPESRQRPESAVSNVESTTREFKQESYSELPPPAQAPVKSALKQPKAEAKAVEMKPVVDMKEGEFNEAESHNSFLEALNAWRGVKPAEKGVKFEDKKPGSFFAGLKKDENWDVNCLPQYAEGGTKPDKQMEDPKYGPKESCWTCYKLKPVSDIVEFAGKKFCSDKCKEKF